MGMHFGMTAVRGSISDLRAAFSQAWPTFEITAIGENFSNGEEIWSWMKEHEHFVSSSAWSKDNPGTQCGFITQAGPWAIFMDPSYVLASDEKALKVLSRQFGAALSFLVETAGGCAYFWYYESGELRRAVINNGDSANFEGSALSQEEGINMESYYMEETEALMRAFGLPSIEELPLPSITMALALTDRTDYTEARKRRAEARQSALSQSLGISETTTTNSSKKPWWKFW